jgi:hypothetical protein
MMFKARIDGMWLGWGASLVTAALMLVTEPCLAIVWDEGYTLGREERLRGWCRALEDPARFAATWRPPAPAEELVQNKGAPPPLPGQIDSRKKLLLDREVLAWFWPFAREEPHGHPPFYALLGLAGDVLAPSWRELPRARLGPILLFAVTGGAICVFAAARFGIPAAALAWGSWVFQPNLFGHGHYASYDCVLTSLWVLAVIVFAHATFPSVDSARRRMPRLATAAFGVILGCAAATKLTGWLLPVPFLAWAAVYRSRQGFRTLFLGMLTAIVVLFALVPPWWTAPFAGVMRFLDSNLTRGRTIPIQIEFLGTVYNTPRESLPWYNTLVWTAFVTPIGFLVMAGLGVLASLRNWRTESIGPLVTGHWAFLMVLRALPHTPGHDGVRQFLPAFGMLALLGGLGARWLLARCGRWAKIAIAAAVIEGATSVAVMMPVPLSYYSPIVGGLPGATALGMEPTYYWDSLDRGARQWLVRNTAPGRTIAFRGFSTSWLYLRRTGDLPRQLLQFDHGTPQWLVIQNRPGAFSRADRALVAEGVAAYTVTKLGVPLVWIFPCAELDRLNVNRAQPDRTRQKAAFARPDCSPGRNAIMIARG